MLESGFGNTLDIWQTIQPRVAANCARTYSYNRAGYLDSDPAVAARDAASIVAELRQRSQLCAASRRAALRGNIPPARHMRNPPINAKSLLPRRAPFVIFLSLRALPPPRTT